MSSEDTKLSSSGVARRPSVVPAFSTVVIVVTAAVVLVSSATSAVALVAGIAIALTLGNPWPEMTRAISRRALTAAVVGLGAGVNLAVVGRVGVRGLGYTAIGLGTAFLVGSLLGRWYGVDRDASLLVTVGTAICGGSAIAAVGPVIHADDQDMTMALITVFLLNAVGLVMFPFIGHAAGLSEDAFGLWCALAIHDTSAVVGAAAQYGRHALDVATAAKLARALWIVPVTMVIAFVRVPSRKGEGRPPISPPWFIGGFVLVSALVTYAPALSQAGALVAAGARHLLATTLFLIGLGISRTNLKQVGARSLAHAASLWIILATLTFAAVKTGWIH